MAKRPGKHTPFFELVDAQHLAGCAVCRLAYRSTDRYLDMLLYEAVLDPTVRAKLKASRGFCQRHVAMLHARPGRSLKAVVPIDRILRGEERVIDTKLMAHAHRPFRIMFSTAATH